jgi:hypothetical protein
MELFRTADREKLLFVKDPDPANRPPLNRRRTAATQRALSLLVLFDQVVMHNLSNEDMYRLPEL